MSNVSNDKTLNTCGCCEVDDLDYPAHYNRPGQDALAYRLETHSGFLRRMLEGLSRDQLSFDTLIANKRPLARLSTRSSDDPTVALLDAWSIIADVITFYQERIANEGYIRTATERRSVLELARSIGYELNPGVAASTYFAFTADSSPGSPQSVTIPERIGVMSIPDQESLPQVFETVEEITARSKWNKLKPNTQIKTITDPIKKDDKQLLLAGVNTGLQAGDGILIVGDTRIDLPGSERWDFRILQSVTPVTAENYTLVTWELGLGHEIPLINPATSSPIVYAFRLRASVFGHNAPDWKSLDDGIKARYVPSGIDGVTSVAFSSDGRHVVCGTVDSTIKFWNVRSGNVRQAFSGHKGSVNSVDVYHDDAWIISGGDDTTVRVWEVESGTLLHTFFEHHASVNSVAFSPDGVFAVSGSSDNTLIIWSMEQWRPLEVTIIDDSTKTKVLKKHNGAVNAVTFFHEVVGDVGTREWKMLSCGNDGKLIYWILYEKQPEEDVEDQSLFYEIEFIENQDSHIGAVNCLAFSANGDQVISGGADKTLKRWQLGEDSWTLLKIYTGHTGHDASITSVTFLGNDHIVSSSADKTVKLWDLNNGAVIKTYSEHDSTVTSVAAQPGRNDRFISGSMDKKMLLWDKDENNSKKELSGPTFDYINEWPNYEIELASQNPSLDLDNLYPTVLPGSWIVLTKPKYVELYKVDDKQVAWRTDFGLEAKVSRLFLDAREHLTWFDLRKTIVFAQSESLKQFTRDVPQKIPIEGDAIVLDRMLQGLDTERTVVVSGKRMRALVLGAQAEDTAISETNEVTAECLVLRSADGFSQVDVKPGDVLEVIARPQAYPSGNIVWCSQEDGFTGVVVTTTNNNDACNNINDDNNNSIRWYLRDRNGFIGYVYKIVAETIGDKEPTNELNYIPAKEIVLIPPIEEDDVVSEIAFINAIGESRDRKNTVLNFESALTSIFDHDSVSINANVARATHGETIKDEVLGSGDGTKSNQSFKLNHIPLTYVSAATPTGGETTLKVRVNDVLWAETPSLYEVGPRSQSYMVRLDNEGNTFITFGDGINGARLPTGQENIKATYRKGIGPGGEVGTERIKLLSSKPLGITEVTNPLSATGAAAPEPLTEARLNAPLTVLTLDRIVSIKDFEDFAAAFAGIGKAQAITLWNGEISFAHITIAATNGDPVDATSQLYINLVQALDLASDRTMPVRVDTYIPGHFNIKAKINYDARYIREKVDIEIKSSLMSAFSFAERKFGQQVTEAEVVTAIQGVEGVIAVELVGLGYHTDGIPESAEKDPLPEKARRARWDGNQVQLAELLLINPGSEGVTLVAMEEIL